MSDALADAEWCASWIGLAKSLEYDLRKRDTLNREFKIQSIMTEKETGLDAAAVTDAKSLYDNLTREQFSGAEKRAALEICVIRDSLDSLGGSAHWVPHEENPVDCMTKLKGNASRMLELMRTGRYRLTEEAVEMTKRKEFREKTGKRNPRPNSVYFGGHSRSGAELYSILFPESSGDFPSFGGVVDRKTKCYWQETPHFWVRVLHRERKNI